MRRVIIQFVSVAVFLAVFSFTGLAHDGKGTTGTKEAIYQTGYDRGYSDGYRHGEEDNRAGIHSDPNSQELKRADRGYENSMKHKGDYKKGYKEGYLTGYQNGYERYSSRGRSARASSGRYPYPERARGRNTQYGGAYDVGLDQGYRDGLEKGESDLQKNRDPDENRHSQYKNADHGYNSSYGVKRDYQQGYRRGFEEGYDNGYRGRDRLGRARYGGRNDSIRDSILGRRT